MTNDTGTHQPPVDFSRIQDTSDGDTEFEQELFQAYIEDCSDRITRLREAVAAGDADALKREAHTIKGASANVGTTRLHEIAQSLEATDIADAGTVADLITQIEAEFEQVKVAINDYLGST